MNSHLCDYVIAYKRGCQNDNIQQICNISARIFLCYRLILYFYTKAVQRATGRKTMFDKQGNRQQKTASTQW